MATKINRDIALIRFRKLPLLEYDDKIDTEVFYYPKSFSFHWIKLEKLTNKRLTNEFKELVQLLDIRSLIILGQFNKPWISKFTRERKDFKALTKAIKYFKSIKVGKKFNGAIIIQTEEIDVFISNFYTLTRCDSGFSDFYITDVGENLLFHIHYSGEIKILTLRKETKERLRRSLSQTKFIDALREGTDRIDYPSDPICSV
jgi:hypothetical protein